MRVQKLRIILPERFDLCFCGQSQSTGIRHEVNQGIASVIELLGSVGVCCNGSQEFVVCFCRFLNGTDGILYLGVGRVCDMSEICSQVGRADENTVHALHGGGGPFG